MGPHIYDKAYFSYGLQTPDGDNLTRPSIAGSTLSFFLSLFSLSISCSLSLSKTHALCGYHSCIGLMELS